MLEAIASRLEAIASRCKPLMLWPFARAANPEFCCRPMCCLFGLVVSVLGGETGENA